MVIDLDAVPPLFEVTYEGAMRSFDICELSLKLSTLRETPNIGSEAILAAVRDIMGMPNLTSYQMMIFLGEFNKFSEEHLGPPFRRLFGDALFSAPTMGFPQKSSESLPPTSISG
jgi:hypothetical protein